ncbi:MAG: baeRF10 domain-containing protein, partial [Actinomycetota bacterium]
MFTHDEIERIKNYQATEDTILSVYLNLGPDIREGRSVRARLVDLLKPILGSTERMEHDRAEALRADVQTVMSMEERIQADRGHGVALFSCHATGFFGYLSLPAGVWDAATAGPSPYIRPLMAVLEAYPKMVAVVVDRKRSDLFAFSMAGVEAHEEVVSDVLRSKHFGGWYGLEEYRTQHRAVELAHHHYKDTVTRLEELFHRFGADVLCVGGHNDTTDEFLPFLPAHLADRLIGTFHVDPHTMTPSIVRDRCADLRLAHVTRQHERDVEVLLQTAERGGLAVLGLARTLDAVNAGAVSTLLVDGGGEVPGYVCDRCH